MMKLSVVGTGNIIPYHLDALRVAGFDFETLWFHSNENRARDLMHKYGFKNITNKLDNLKKAKVDGILIAISAEYLDSAYAKLWDLNLPTLIEKPVTYSKDFFQGIPQSVAKVTQVAFNRRFYDSVRQFREEISQVKNCDLSFRIQLPENSWNGNYDTGWFYQNLISNTIHGIDLMHFLFGEDLEITYVQSCFSADIPSSIEINLKSSGIKGSLLITNGIPDNYKVQASWKGKRAVLEPLERFYLFNRIVMVEPNSETPLRTYQAINESDWFTPIEDVNYKPGFLRQAYAFRELCESKTLSPNSASIKNAEKAIERCYEIIGHIQNGQKSEQGNL